MCIIIFFVYMYYRINQLQVASNQKKKKPNKVSTKLQICNLETTITLAETGKTIHHWDFTL